ncbi:uncharacterized protein TNCV_4895341 [Trichonephila clavipes]|nr:uncharacterized protein TNCV_4895341 [Trichonephila clavipes]
MEEVQEKTPYTFKRRKYKRRLHTHLKIRHETNLLRRKESNFDIGINLSTVSKPKPSGILDYFLKKEDNLGEIISKMTVLDSLPFREFCISNDLRKALSTAGAVVPTRRRNMSHSSCHNRFIERRFVDRLISRFGPVNWPPRSCDLTPLDYFLWSYVKSLVYADNLQTLDHLEDNIRRVIADIRPQMLGKVIENWRLDYQIQTRKSRVDYIRASRGSHMPEIIFKWGHHSGAQRVNPEFRVGSHFRIIPEQYFSRVENVVEFLENMDNNVTYYEIPTQLACAYLKGHLTGRALDWFEVLRYRVVEDKATDYTQSKRCQNSSPWLEIGRS